MIDRERWSEMERDDGDDDDNDNGGDDDDDDLIGLLHTSSKIQEALLKY